MPVGGSPVEPGPFAPERRFGKMGSLPPARPVLCRGSRRRTALWRVSSPADADPWHAHFMVMVPESVPAIPTGSSHSPRSRRVLVPLSPSPQFDFRYRMLESVAGRHPKPSFTSEAVSVPVGEVGGILRSGRPVLASFSPAASVIDAFSGFALRVSGALRLCSEGAVILPVSRGYG